MANLFAKLMRKALGLPTGEKAESCCTVPGAAPQKPAAPGSEGKTTGK